MFITSNNTVLSVDDNTVLSVSLPHQQDAALTRTVNYNDSVMNLRG